jgi:hypothetical protein
LTIAAMKMARSADGEQFRWAPAGGAAQPEGRTEEADDVLIHPAVEAEQISQSRRSATRWMV